MNPELKKYLAEIGGRGGSAATEKKAKAVRKNGALGGRPRKDGRPAGAKFLEDVIHAIETSKLPKAAKHDLRLWAHSNATVFHEGKALLTRDQVVQVEESLGGKINTLP